jgi:hypothetical protein
VRTRDQIVHVIDASRLLQASRGVAALGVASSTLLTARHLFLLFQYHMQSNYKLNCLVSGGDLSHIFEIKIAPTESVSALKELIKEKQKHAFRDVDANRLDLWKVSDLMPTIGC